MLWILVTSFVDPACNPLNALRQVRALEALLEKHGLHDSSTSGEIQAVRAAIAKQKELEGIDMSNIISAEGRRPRRAAAAAVSYAAPKYADSDDEEEDEEDNGESSNSQVCCCTCMAGHEGTGAQIRRMPIGTEAVMFGWVGIIVGAVLVLRQPGCAHAHLLY